MPVQPFGLIVLVAVLSIGHVLWRRSTARDEAERWLAVHRYQVLSLTTPMFTLSHFAPRMFRNADRAFVFRAEVEDRQMGGTGVVWLRVWTSWLAMIDGEIEVSWERMPERARGADGELPLDERWALRQQELLRRVAAGESTFRPDGRGEVAGEQFDDTVEYLLALQRRGLIRCAAPMANLRGGSLYAALTDVELTPAGEKELERLETPRR